MSAAIDINGVPLPVVERNGERLITLAMIDQAHRRPDGTARRNFNEHRQQMVLGEDFHEMDQADEIRRLGIVRPQGGQPAKLILLTESGYLMLVKSLTDDLAWQVQRQLVRSYFRPTVPDSAPGLTPADRRIVGGIFQRVGAKAFTAAALRILDEMLPSMVAAAVASHRFEMVEGVTATDVIELAGYATGRRPRGLTQFVSPRLTNFHGARGLPVRRSRRGRGGVKLFDESTARAWLGAGGQVAIDTYVAERKGQGKLALPKR